jgi:hypothetical protein
VPPPLTVEAVQLRSTVLPVPVLVGCPGAVSVPVLAFAVPVPVLVK